MSEWSLGFPGRNFSSVLYLDTRSTQIYISRNTTSHSGLENVFCRPQLQRIGQINHPQVLTL
jgi:hypothetical protein